MIARTLVVIVAGIAPAAKRMGRHVGRQNAARVAGRPEPPFRYRHAGDLATIGRGAAVVKLDDIHLTGFVGWLFWSIVHVYLLIGVRNRFVVAFSWLWNHLSYQRGARLITGEGVPKPASASPLGSSAPASAGLTRVRRAPGTRFSRTSR